MLDACVSVAHIRRALHGERYTLRSWAIKNGFSAATVDTSIRRAIKNGCYPAEGTVANNVVIGLEETVGFSFFAELENNGGSS